MEKMPPIGDGLPEFHDGEGGAAAPFAAPAMAAVEVVCTFQLDEAPPEYVAQYQL